MGLQREPEREWLCTVLQRTSRMLASEKASAGVSMFLAKPMPEEKGTVDLNFGW